MAGREGALIAMLVVLAFVNSAAAKNYNVNSPGTNSGWAFLISNTSYDDFFKKITFFVGDSLTFVFTTGVHNVNEVLPPAIPACDSSNPIRTYTQTTTVTLNTAGQHAFLCSFPSHCSSYGMHLLVTVGAFVGPSAGPAEAPQPMPEPGGEPGGGQTGAPSLSAASFLRSGSAMIVGALIVACAVLAL